MDSFILTVTDPGRIVVPRRIRLALAAGDGRLALPAGPPLDADCRASLTAAWQAATLLADRRDADGALEIAGPTPIRGASAGLPFGILALAALCGERLPPHFATGGVTGPDGFLAGGLAAREKAEAAARYAPQLGMSGAVFLAPPIEPPAGVGIPVLPVADLGSAYARLAPAAYAKVAERHRQVRRAAFAADAPFALVVRHGGPPLPAEVGGVRLREVQDEAASGGLHVAVGEGGLVLWRTALLPDADLAAEIPRILGLVRASAVV